MSKRIVTEITDNTELEAENTDILGLLNDSIELINKQNINFAIKKEIIDNLNCVYSELSLMGV